MNRPKQVPFSKVTMWAGAVEAWMEAYLVAPNYVELLTSVGNEVPLQHRGTIVEMIQYGEIWIAARKSEGFEEAMALEWRE